MKTFKSKIAILIIAAGLLLSCKNNTAGSGQGGMNSNVTDSTQTTTDSVGKTIDSTNNGTGTGGPGKN